jgi:hypothetical protein
MQLARARARQKHDWSTKSERQALTAEVNEYGWVEVRNGLLTIDVKVFLYDDDEGLLNNYRYMENIGRNSDV